MLGAEPLRAHGQEPARQQAVPLDGEAVSVVSVASGARRAVERMHGRCVRGQGQEHLPSVPSGHDVWRARGRT